ncbi:MAG: hypothetical protein RIC55_30265 [Pirellulaceae bacterium]
MSPRLPKQLFCVFGLLAVGVSGCAAWTKESASSSSMRLPLPPLSSDSVVLEVTFVHLPPDTAELDRQLWREVDEQQLPAELRRQLASNGFRGGLVGNPLPNALRTYLEQQDSNKSPTDPESDGPKVDELTMQLRKRMRAGHRNDIVASPTLDSLPVLRVDEGRIVGQTYQQAQCRFAARTFPQGDGRVRIELVPEIHHGDIRQRWIGDNRALRLDAGQQRQSFDELQIEATLSPGQTLLLTCTNELKGLGQYFFSDGEKPTVGRRMLLIRLTQTQMDDRFLPEEIAAANVSATE